MKTVAEALAFLESEKERLAELGTYIDDVAYLEYLITKIKGGDE